MSKRLLITLVFACFCLASKAQVEKGTKLIGGALSLDLAFDDDDEADDFLLNPSYGVFIVDRIALGGNLRIAYDKKGETGQTDISLGPFARLYILGNAQLRMMIDARTGYLYSVSKVGDVSSTDHGFQFFGGPGLSYFLNDNVSLDAVLGYNYRTFGADANSSNLRLVAGLQIYLSK